MNHKLEKLLPKELIGLYRDDGLAVTNLPGPDQDRLRNHKLEKLFPKELIGLYRDDGLAVTSLDQTWTDCLKRW